MSVYVKACESCSDFYIVLCVTGAHITVWCMVSNPLFSFIPPYLYTVYVCVCSTANLLSTEHAHHPGEKNTAIFSHPSVTVYPSFSTPLVFVSALLSLLLFFPSLWYVLVLPLSFIPHHSLFSIMFLPTGQVLSFFLYFPFYYSHFTFI